MKVITTTAILLLLWIIFNEEYHGSSNTGSPLCGELATVDSVCQDLVGRNSNHSYPFNYEDQIAPDFTSEFNFFILDSTGADQPLPCVQSVRYFSCLLTAPPCDVASDLPLRICPESCLAFNTLMESSTCDDFQNSLESVDILSLKRLLDFYLLLDCSNTTTYSFVGQNVFDNDSCTSIFSPEVQDDVLRGVFNISATTATTTQQPFPVVSVGVSVGVALVVVVGVVIMVLMAVKSRRGRSRGVKKEEEKHGRKITRRRTLKMQPVTDARVIGNFSEVALKGSFVNHNSTKVNFELSDAMPLENNHYRELFGSKVVAYENLRVGESIGEGAFGKVLEGYYLRDGVEHKIAIKTLKAFSSHDAEEEFFSECLLMKNFDHPNVLGLVGVCFDSPDDIPYLLLPFMENGNIKDFLKKRRHHVTDFETLPQGMTEQQLFEMCAGVCRGMEYLATNRFVHRDLAARNCMLSSNLDVCVSDFGLARDVYSSDYYRTPKGARLPVKWMPPETLHDTVSNEKTDVWAYGVTCWEVYSLGRTPYPGIPSYDILKFIAEGERLNKPALCPQQLFNLLSSCWHEDANQRPTFSQLSHAIDTMRQSLFSSSSSLL